MFQWLLAMLAFCWELFKWVIRPTMKIAFWLIWLVFYLVVDEVILLSILGLMILLSLGFILW